MKVRTLTLAGVALVAVVALAVLGTWRWTQATGPDVNNDGFVGGPSPDPFTNHNVSRPS